MESLSIRAESLLSLSHHNPNSRNSVFDSSLRHRRISLFPPKDRLEFRVSCGIKETRKIEESQKKVDGILTGLRVDEVDVDLGGPVSGSGVRNEEVGFSGNWPPWKNMPQRYKLIGTTSLAFVICNMDKVNLSIAIIPMSHQFGWSSSVAGLVQSSFFWGYALSQLPGGWLAKIFGGRKVLKFGVLTWSLATALVPVLAGYMPSLLLSRILVGIGEGVSPSSATDLIARHNNTFGRALTSCGVCFWWFECRKCCRISLGSTPNSKSWLGVCVLHIWPLGSRLLLEDNATLAAESTSGSQTKSVNKNWNDSLGELGDSLKGVPWKAFFRTPAVWAMVYAHFCGSWGHYTCLSWLPTYFSEELSLNLTEAAWVSILPPLASVVVTSIASQIADNLIANGVETTTVRKLCQTIAFMSPAVCMTLSSVDLGLPPWEVVGILTSGLALSSFALSGLYCTHQDMSPEYASILLGMTNTVGAVPGIVGIALTGYLLDITHSWSLSLFAPSIFFYLTGTVVWLAFASSKPQSFSERD
ncbi:hypothetical protein F8388_004430 [Cannabis sativa]|uniref:Major facilitator superfamily (MFS) profile domain-containing protein n=1 Tax=Cannabis sativa TaxID=3483 RepID=A0A7J6HAY9_CANSA|nr:hypothetical protein F8388_004430 [Cannabis sativa]